MTNELEEFIIIKQNSSVSPLTVKNYRNQYKSIRALLNGDFNKSTEEEILDAVSILSKGNPSNEWTYLCLPYMMRESKKLSTDVIQARRNELKVLREEHIYKQKIVKNDTLPDISVIQKFTKDLFNNKDYKKFIVNYLIINYGVRNQDVDVFIVNSKKMATDAINNYLILKKNEVEWVINNYKTFKNYGVKNIIIKSKPFLQAVKELPLNTYLLTGTDTRLNYSGLATSIKRLLYENLTEGDYFKIILADVTTKPNSIELLQFYSHKRGTDYNTLIHYYSSNAKEDIEINDEIFI